MIYFDDLRSFPLFSDVPDNQIRWLAERVEERTLPENTVLVKPQEPIDYLNILLDGQIRLDGGAQGTGEEIASFDAPTVLGVLPFSRLREANTFMQTATPVRMLWLHRDHLRPMTESCYELTEALVQRMTDRVRTFTQQAQQEEKMASLGRLSAGLAHELNNPVAAVVRNADALKEHLGATSDRFKVIMSLDISDEQVDTVNDWLFRKIGQPTPNLSMMDRNRREDDLIDWLDDQNVPDASGLAGSLVAFGFAETDLDFLLDAVGDANLAGVLNWVENNLVTEKMVLDIGEASKRIATLVQSIKSYTHMDRGAGRETVRLADGIRSTLTLLNHKLKTKAIAVTLDIPDDLLPVSGWPGELNQVWTNLLDNAIDALPDAGGQIAITAELDRGQFVVTHITDNGPGVPSDIQSKIFEPFFTTKPIGKGSGLGLDIVKGIITHHNGSIKVKSQPGQTIFAVCLPVQ
jgi:signal transduction histidine kinase